jgi:membrane fusion protein (multidrug efflux system)
MAKETDSAIRAIHATPDSSHHESQPSAPAPGEPPAPDHRWRNRLLLLGVLVLGAVIAAPFVYLMIDRALKTVSTDDAYVNGHVTFVAPRVAGQVTDVLVDDNKRVSKGDLLVQIDPQPYQVQVGLKKAAVQLAKADVKAAEAQIRGLEALARSQRWKTQTAVEQVDNQIALLRAKVAALKSSEAVRARARSDFERAEKTVGTGATSREEYDQRLQALRVAEAQVRQSLEEVYQIRASLGLPPIPEKGEDLTQVPPDLDQNFSAVRTNLAELVQTAAQIGLPLASNNATPKEFIETFKKLDSSGDIDRILADLVPKAPAVLQAKAKLAQAENDLALAELNLSYCEVHADIDGLVTRRNVNPGNYVQAGQQVMAVRSITEVWIDANFKETELADLRIGQPVELHTDMYGKKRVFQGRISGFTMGTGSTLSLLPPQNATGNFVKVVQRLPVRIDLTEPNPEDSPLFVGLSVEPYVFIKERPTGPDAGKFLQQASPLPAPKEGRQ